MSGASRGKRSLGNGRPQKMFHGLGDGFQYEGKRKRNEKAGFQLSC